MTATEAARMLEKHLGPEIDKAEARSAAAKVRRWLEWREIDWIDEYLMDRVEQIESRLAR